MTKEEAIKYLKQIYPNGGGTWLDEQRIEAIGMAITALEEPVSEDLEEAANEFAGINYDCETESDSFYHMLQKDAFKTGANWQKEQMMRDAIDWEIEGEKVKVIIIEEEK